MSDLTWLFVFAIILTPPTLLALWLDIVDPIKPERPSTPVPLAVERLMKKPDCCLDRWFS